MPTVHEVIQRVLPQGTNPAPPGQPALIDWRVAPLWPPDLFAVTATLVSLSGAYAHASVTGSTAASAASSDGFPARVKAHGEAWREQGDPVALSAALAHVQTLWTSVLSAASAQVSEVAPLDSHPWCDAALELMAMADEASAGIGFEGDSPSWLFREIAERHFARASHGLGADRTTATVCKLVPPEECCVQPKSRTPQVGCTVRSLSHHLALLPPVGEVTTTYLVSPRPLSTDALNLLLVPFPYALDDQALRRRVEHRGERWGRFAVAQTWLPAGDVEASSDAIVGFLLALLGAAPPGVPVHGLVLPELALDGARAAAVARRLARSGLRLFVTGVLSEGPAGHPPRNTVTCVLYQDGAPHQDWSQSKHHRWRLEASQIASYGLPLDPELLWWEDIDVSRRVVRFCNFLDGATLAALVCEDLARIDPVQPVVRAVGPNLVIALLMDGPQHEHRWPGRYATVLAEDPGSSVLTLTSAALVDRHLRLRRDPPDSHRSRAIGLWKESTCRTRELVLPEGHHALLLRLKVATLEERTMDRRSDDGVTREVRWDGCDAVRVADPPGWLNPPPSPANLSSEASRGPV